MYARLEERLLQSEERAQALSMGHHCPGAHEELRLAVQEVVQLRRDLKVIHTREAAELLRRADHIYLELICEQRKCAPRIAA